MQIVVGLKRKLANKLRPMRRSFNEYDRFIFSNCQFGLSDKQINLQNAPRVWLQQSEQDIKIKYINGKEENCVPHWFSLHREINEATH